jgi:hypothetical protein
MEKGDRKATLMRDKARVISAKVSITSPQAATRLIVSCYRYVSECTALEWTYNQTHIEACLPMADLLDSSTIQVQSDAAPWAIQSFLAFLQPPSN